MSRVRIPRRRWVGRTPTPLIAAARTSAPPGTVSRLDSPLAPATHVAAVDGADQPVQLEQLPVHLEHLVGVVIAKGDGDRLEEGPQVRGIVGRLAELDGVVMHDGILP